MESPPGQPLEAGPWDVGAGAGAQGKQPNVNVEAQGLVQPGAHRGGAGAVADDVEAGAFADVAAGADEILNSSTSTSLFPN